jgi:3'-phosphoadenosine 5'-phosphosulfate sulfotransferase (PAPS reductase)/FAD synthetase
VVPVTTVERPTLGLGEGFDTPADVEHDPLNPDWEVPTPINLVVALTQSQREERVQRLVAMAKDRYAEALAVHAVGATVRGTCLLLSGGNDSYTVAHLFRDQATHIVHANTGTGMEATREHVRGTAKAWGLPLLEVHPKPGEGYDDIVRGNVYARSKATGELVQAWPGGFPGPAAHQVMYIRLKERGLETVPHLLGVSGSRTDRIVYVSGRRRAESERRKNVPHHERKGTVIWSSPIAVWHKADLRTYRLMVGDVPVNPVAERLGMSGECGCLANAKPGEADRWRATYPDDPFVLRMDALEREIADRPDIDPVRKRWGNASLLPTEDRSEGGLLCGKDCGPDPLLDLMDPLFELERGAAS